MMPTNGLLEINIELSGQELEQLDISTRQLYTELKSLEIETIKFFVSKEPQPEGVKAVDPATVNALILTVSPILITKLLEFLHSWNLRKDGRSIKIKIQKQDGQSVEVEVPASTSPKVLNDWLNSVEALLTNPPKEKKK